MAKREENVLVVRRALFDRLGSFQGFSRDVQRYLPAFLSRENNFFAPRSAAELDPSLKQIIPYAVFRRGQSLLHYVRGAKSGEKRLVAKGSIGIGGHINDCDEGLFACDEAAYRAAVEREIAEELQIEKASGGRIVGLINDDSTEVGKVHLGVVHLVDIDSKEIARREAAITKLQFHDLDELRARRDTLETWSRIVIENWREIAE